MQNQVRVQGRLIERQALRYTPAGMPAVEFRLAHESTQREAGGERQIRCEIACLCLGALAPSLAKLPEGAPLAVEGFLAARNQRQPSSLVLHVIGVQTPTGSATTVSARPEY